MTPPAARGAAPPPAPPSMPLALRHELARKGIHLATAMIPVAYAVGLPRLWLLWLLTALCATAVAAELGRSRYERTRALVERAAGRLFREHERERWSGATWLAIALLAAAILFPRDVAVTAMWAVSVGDAAAAVVGRMVGSRRRARAGEREAARVLPWGPPPELHDRVDPPSESNQDNATRAESAHPAPIRPPSTPLRWVPGRRRGARPRPAAKSLAGSLACAGATAAGALLVAHLPPGEGVAAAAVAALAERPRAPLDDNVRIVLAVGVSLLLLRALGA